MIVRSVVSRQYLVLPRPIRHLLHYITTHLHGQFVHLWHSPPLLMELDPDDVQNTIQRLFNTSKNPKDNAFRHFANALCTLSSGWW